MTQKELLDQAPLGTEVKKIGHTTYIKHEDIVLEIKGPYRPGSVWKLESYKTRPEFQKAWDENKITTRQRGVDPGLDAFAAAMSFGQCNAIHSDLFTENKCIGYRFESKGETLECACHYLNHPPL